MEKHPNGFKGLLEAHGGCPSGPRIFVLRYLLRFRGNQEAPNFGSSLFPFLGTNPLFLELDTVGTISRGALGTGPSNPLGLRDPHQWLAFDFELMLHNFRLSQQSRRKLNEVKRAGTICVRSHSFLSHMHAALGLVSEPEGKLRHLDSAPKMSAQPFQDQS